MKILYRHSTFIYLTCLSCLIVICFRLGKLCALSEPRLRLRERRLFQKSFIYHDFTLIKYLLTVLNEDMTFNLDAPKGHLPQWGLEAVLLGKKIQWRLNEYTMSLGLGEKLFSEFFYRVPVCNL